jgi:hypothetical protein
VFEFSSVWVFELAFGLSFRGEVFAQIYFPLIYADFQLIYAEYFRLEFSWGVFRTDLIPADLR